jgi:hypothetical protein
MADRRREELTESALAWALRRAIHFAIATCVVALLLAACLSGADAERFATTAYLAAFFAAVSLAIEHFLAEADRSEQRSSTRPIFPTILGWAASTLVSIWVVAALVAKPDGEILAIIAGFALVLLAALARSGAFTPFSAFLSAAIRPRNVRAAAMLVLAVAIAALLLAALLPPDESAIATTLGFRLFLIAAFFFVWPVVAETRLGKFLSTLYTSIVVQLDRRVQELRFDWLATSAGAVAAVALIVASVEHGDGAEPFAVIAYLAAAAATVGVAMECRRLRG